MSKFTQGVDIKVSEVVYGAMIMAPPGDLTTFYTMLKRAKESVNVLGFEYTPGTFDIGLLTKPLEVQWS